MRLSLQKQPHYNRESIERTPIDGFSIFIYTNTIQPKSSNIFHDL